ncbi:hypothetical protein BH695_5210 [Microcystis aeruginosa PCC 7806SL]|uniref:Uncharacterized protein n=1 Tax=Microcystis aeruginosa PCC 7806SL TaxID=1903187 RepID=A0AB33BX06_MICA7|nr:hypothetical protein BH695_5210 [Microcystis aeruginosa PCC 7806SL]
MQESGVRSQEAGDYFYLFSPHPTPHTPHPHPTPHTPHPTPRTPHPTPSYQ